MTADSVAKGGADRIEQDVEELLAIVDAASEQIAGLGLDWPDNWLETSRTEVRER